MEPRSPQEPEKFICDQCHREVLESNRLTHEARCQKYTSSPLSNISPTINTTTNNNNMGIGQQNLPQSQIQAPSREYYIEDLRAPETIHEKIKCSKCNKSVEKNQLKHHEKYDCEAEKIPCEFCQTPVIAGYYKDHVENCSRNPEHINLHSMENVMIPCENCGQKINAHVYEAHTNECIRSPTGRSTQNRSPTGRNTQTRSPTGRNMQNRSPTGGMTNETIPCRFCNQFLRPHEINRHEANHARHIDETPTLNPLARMLFGYTEVDDLMSSPGSRNSLRELRGLGSNLGQQTYRSYVQDGHQVIEQSERDENGRTIRLVRYSSRDDRPGSAIINLDNNEREIDNQNPFHVLFSILNPGMILDGGSLENFLSQSQSNQKPLDKRISENLVTAKFDKDKNKNMDEEAKKCSVCLTEFQNGEEIKFLPCLHRFHGGCIDPWLKSHSTCPLCKKDFNEMLKN